MRDAAAYVDWRAPAARSPSPGWHPRRTQSPRRPSCCCREVLGAARIPSKHAAPAGHADRLRRRRCHGRRRRHRRHAPLGVPDLRTNALFVAAAGIVCLHRPSRTTLRLRMWLVAHAPATDVHMGMIVALPNNTIAVAFQESSFGEAGRCGGGAATDSCRAATTSRSSSRRLWTGA